MLRKEAINKKMEKFLKNEEEIFDQKLAIMKNNGQFEMNNGERSRYK